MAEGEHLGAIDMGHGAERRGLDIAAHDLDADRSSGDERCARAAVAPDAGGGPVAPARDPRDLPA